MNLTVTRFSTLTVVLIHAFGFGASCTVFSDDQDPDISQGGTETGNEASTTTQPTTNQPDNTQPPTTQPAADSDQSVFDPLSIKGDIIKDYSLTDGDCFNRLEEFVDNRKVVVTSRVDCEKSHTYEVFHTFEIDAPHPTPYPGDTAMQKYALQLCYDQFADFVGEIYELSVYEIGVFTPNRTNFEHERARYRQVHCWLHRDDLAPMATSAKDTGI